jgi:geranylgeranyl diphosphate synthase type II
MPTMEALVRLVEADLASLWSSHEENLDGCLAALAHPTMAGGKRVRPVLTLLCAAALGGEDGLRRARPTACALELVHTYSLVHDDLPCMDDDSLRRGQPTSHVLYGEAKALLVGDGLLTHAFALIGSRGRAAPWNETLASRDEAADVTEALALAAGPYGMVGGQWLDVSATPDTRPRNQGCANEPQAHHAHTFALVEQIHLLKTGRLLGAALECGAIHGMYTRRGELAYDDFEAALEDARRHAREAGEFTGLAFQLVDDVLDATRSSASLGKTAGKDAAAGKLTSVSVLGIEGARERAAHATAKARQAMDRLLMHASAGAAAGVTPRAAANSLTRTLAELLTRES